MSERPRLLKPSQGLRTAIQDMAGECDEAGDVRYLAAAEDFDAWLGAIEAMARGEDLKPGHVPRQLFCLTLGERVLGCSRLRFELDAGLLDEGGHVGYDIRPSERGRGYGTLLLALTLEEAASRGIERVRVTSDDDNVPSWRVIERNGGVLDDKGLSEESGKLVRRYWIDRGSPR